jgi:hypothetical protein
MVVGVERRVLGKVCDSMYNDEFSENPAREEY